MTQARSANIFHCLRHFASAPARRSGGPAAWVPEDTLFLTFNAMFQHANIATPHWLGYLIQRPESHHVHHARGVHAYNYSDLPLWDMLFGTFRNPRNVEGLDCGFYKGASGRLVEMLVGKDVSQPEPRISSLAEIV